MTYQEALEWIFDHFDFDDYDTFEEYIDAVREEFNNDNLIDYLEGELVSNYPDM